MGFNKFEKFANGAQSTLASDINDTTTTVTVATGEGSIFPNDGNYRIMIDTEIMLVTSRTGDTLTVVRGDGVSVATAHVAGSVISLNITKESLKRAIGDYIPLIDDADLKGPMNSLTDGSTILTLSDFTWVNQGTSTAANLSSGGIEMSAQLTTGANVRALVRSSGTAPWAYYGCFFPQPNWNGGASIGHCGLCMRDSTGKLITMGVLADNRLRILKYTNPTTFSADLYGAQDWIFGQPHWFKIEDNNTNLLFYTSTNGLQFQLVASEARTTYMTGGPNQVGFYINSNDTTAQAHLTLVHWSKE